MVLRVTESLREAAPETCAKIAELRAERKPLCERLSYLRACKDPEDAGCLASVDEQKSLTAKIEEIDSTVSSLFATASSRAKGAALQQASSVVNVIAVDASQQQKARQKALERYTRELSKIGKREQQLFQDLSQLADQTEQAAADAPEPAPGDTDVEPAVLKPIETALPMPALAGASGAGSSNDLHCMKCGRLCRNKSGLSQHMKACRPQGEAQETAEPRERKRKRGKQEAMEETKGKVLEANCSGEDGAGNETEAQGAKKAFWGPR
jgi:hypothetical protein